MFSFEVHEFEVKTVCTSAAMRHSLRRFVISDYDNVAITHVIHCLLF